MIIEDRNRGPLAGRRVLLVEDNFLIGTVMRQMLEDLGCEVVGPIASVDDAVRATHESIFDAGLLDINIIGGTSVPVAESLGRQGRPVLFISGYGSPPNLPESMRGSVRLRKPVDERGLGDALIKAVA